MHPGQSQWDKAQVFSAIDHDQKLPGASGCEGHHHIDGKQLTAALVDGLVQPALDNHVQAQHGYAVDQPQPTPKPGIYNHTVQQRNHRRRGRQRSKGANVADLGDQHRAQIATDYIAQVEARHNQADGDFRITLDTGPQTQQSAQQTGAGDAPHPCR